jgi:superfamily II RNA helicase
MSDCLDTFLQQLPFPLDAFQRDAIDVVDAGHSVVVCAPTGSGKTIIAEFAANKALDNGQKLFYTTPLKALSNQKYHDFRQKFGEGNVGLLTGDLTLNRDARLVVMTTEVFRNMLYGLSEDSQLLDRVGYAVLDECHFMNDAERGTVWEESVIYCPPTIQLIALSATVANADELTEWISRVHQDTRLISSDFRPVPLRFSYFEPSGLLPLFEAPGRLNAQIKPSPKPQKGGRPGGGPRRKGFKPSQLLEIMAQKDMLPAIVFTFSRAGCDQSLKETRDLQLLSEVERQTIEQRIQDFLLQHPFLEGSPYLTYLRNGMASHHAGLLPAVKLLVESLFQQGLIKAVFATETLAAGINMPARSTVITSISKRTGEGHRLLTASEFLQMSGRAGRRGMDDVGYVVVVGSPYRNPKDVAKLASAAPEPLSSQFTPTYGMVLNLLQKSSLPEAQYLIRKSFGQYTADKRLQPLEKELAQKTAELDHYIQFACPAALTDAQFHQFLKLKGTLTEAHRAVQVVKKQIKKFGTTPELEAALAMQREERDGLKRQVGAIACDTCQVIDAHIKNEANIRRLQKYLKSLNTVYAREQDLYWQQFMNLVRLLVAADYLSAENPDAPRPTRHGSLAGEIRAENEFYVAELIRHGVWQDVRPETLAAAVACIVSDSIKDADSTTFVASPDTLAVVAEMQKYAARVLNLQEEHSVHTPLHIHPLPSAIVEAWANQVPWGPLKEGTNLDEGTLVRLIRRTEDLLRQFSRIPDMPPGFAQVARLAFALIDRDPVRELDLETDLLEELPESEIADDRVALAAPASANTATTAGLSPEGLVAEAALAELMTDPS